VASSFELNIISNAVFFSGGLDISIGTTHAFYLDLRCLDASTSPSLLLSPNQPDFGIAAGGAYLYVSVGPASGQNQPYPTPDDNTTWQYSTLNGTGSPLASIVLPDVAGEQLYMTMDCPNLENCLYTLDGKILTSSETDAMSHLIPVVELQELNPIHREVPIPAPPVLQSLAVGNQQVNASMNYNSWYQVKVEFCPSLLAAQFGKNQICVQSTVVGAQTSFIGYQQWTSDPHLQENVKKWNTRNPDPNPYNDMSGKGFLYINLFRSLPVTAAQVPSFLYHDVLALGGQGVEPPHINQFNIFYQIIPCSS